MLRKRAGLTAAMFLFYILTGFRMADTRTQELDEYWVKLAHTVETGDFEGYKAGYHQDAVLVSALSSQSYSIAEALEGWKSGFDDTAAGKMTASVAFRFTQRLGDQTTAHETGIFRYTAQQAGAGLVVQYIHFEALLVKRQGWKMLMEYQKALATPEEWEAAR